MDGPNGNRFPEYLLPDLSLAIPATVHALDSKDESHEPTLSSLHRIGSNPFTLFQEFSDSACLHQLLRLSSLLSFVVCTEGLPGRDLSEYKLRSLNHHI